MWKSFIVHVRIRIQIYRRNFLACIFSFGLYSLHSYNYSVASRFNIYGDRKFETDYSFLQKNLLLETFTCTSTPNFGRMNEITRVGFWHRTLWFAFHVVCCFICCLILKTWLGNDVECTEARKEVRMFRRKCDQSLLHVPCPRAISKELVAKKEKKFYPSLIAGSNLRVIITAALSMQTTASSKGGKMKEKSDKEYPDYWNGISEISTFVR